VVLRDVPYRYCLRSLLRDLQVLHGDHYLYNTTTRFDGKETACSCPWHISRSSSSPSLVLARLVVLSGVLTEHFPGPSSAAFDKYTTVLTNNIRPEDLKEMGLLGAAPYEPK
jgi:hypothetical protein